MTPLSSLLVPLDLSAGSHRVLDRTALLPLAYGARVTLLHAVPDSIPRGARERAEGDAHRALDAAATKLSESLPQSIVLETAVKMGTAAAAIAVHAQLMNSELVVVGRGGARGWKELFVGSTAEQVVRQGKLPVLVVRLRARGPYRRPALALDVDEAAHQALAMALRILPIPRPPMTLVHAYDAPFQGLVYPSFPKAEVQEYRRSFRQMAVRRLREFLATVRRAEDISGFDELEWTRELRYGRPGR